VALEVVGALLIASMLIIPAATARPFAHDPEIMAAAVAAVVAAILFTFSTTLAAYRRPR